MAIPYHAETLIETALIAAIAAQADITAASIPVVRWGDLTATKARPAIAVHCADIAPHPTLQGIFIMNPAMMTIGIFTTFNNDGGDRDGTTVHTYLGYVREVITDSGLEATLNATAGLNVYDNGIEIGSADDVEQTQRKRQINQQLNIFGTVVDIP
jgi:hypothetical protein